MRWVKFLVLVFIAVMISGCSNPEELDAKRIAESFRAYYKAVTQQNYGGYERVVLEPMSKERFVSRVACIPQPVSEDPVSQIILGLGNKDARINGVSPWTSRDAEFRVRKVGNKFKIVE